MTIVEMTALSLALGADLFSVAVPLGMMRPCLREIVRMSLVFALFHIVLLVVGASSGVYLARALERIGQAGGSPVVMAENWAGLFGGCVLFLLGLHLLWESRSRKRDCPITLPCGGALFILAVGVSCDALAVGLGMGLLGDGWSELPLVLGIIIFGVSSVALSLGERISRVIPWRMEPLGALALCLWGLYAIWRIAR